MAEQSSDEANRVTVGGQRVKLASGVSHRLCRVGFDGHSESEFEVFQVLKLPRGVQMCRWDPAGFS